MSVLKNIGVCPEEDYPYSEDFQEIHRLQRLRWMLDFIGLGNTIVCKTYHD